MKTISRGAMCSIAGFSALLAAGCISHEQTIYEDVPRQRVEFESDKAARMFYETLSRNPPRRQAESKTEIVIPIVFDHKRRVVPGQNVVFNDAVLICDSNQDGKITETEAQIFADSRTKPHHHD
jgi:uncharacterized protein YcfL